MRAHTLYHLDVRALNEFPGFDSNPVVTEVKHRLLVSSLISPIKVAAPGSSSYLFT